MQLPFQRQHAETLTRHHLLFEKPQWEATPKSKTVSQMGAFVVAAVRAPHDYLHSTIKPVPVPSMPVLKIMQEVGHSYQLWVNDAERVDAMLDEFVGFAKFTSSPQQCHEMLSVTVSLEAQMATLGIMKVIKPQHG